MRQQKKQTVKKIRIGQTSYDVSDLPVFYHWTARGDDLGSGLPQIRISAGDISNEVFTALLALLRSPDPAALIRDMNIVLVYELMRVMDYFQMYNDHDTRYIRHELYGRHRGHVADYGGGLQIHRVYDTISQNFQRHIREQQRQRKTRHIHKMVHQQFAPRLLRRRVLGDAARFVPPDPLAPLVARREPQVSSFYYRDGELQRMLRERDTITVHARLYYNRLFVAYGVVDENGEYRVMENVYEPPPGQALPETMSEDNRLMLRDVHEITRWLQVP